jgi:hypothetical protein
MPAVRSAVSVLDLAATAAIALPLACSPAPRRNLATIPQRQITFDDMCGLQDYFDQRNAAHAPPFRVIDEQSTTAEGTQPDEHGRMQHIQVGDGTYVITDRDARRRLRRLLRDEYVRLPRLHFGGQEGEVHVRVEWWSSGQMRRLRPDRRIEVATEREVVTLPFDPCVGEFLFGAPVYALRRHVLDSDRARAHGEVAAADEDAATDRDASDAATDRDASDAATGDADAAAEEASSADAGTSFDGSAG